MPDETRAREAPVCGGCILEASSHVGALDARPRWTRDTESRPCRQRAKVAAAPSRCVPYVRSTVPARGLAPPRLDPHHLIPRHRRPRAYPSPLPPLPVPSVIKTGVISQAAGSAYVEFDKTKVMCGVYGPRQGGKMGGATNDRGRVEVDVKLATLAKPGGKTGQGDAEREFSSLVLRALEGAIIAETFPKTSVDVYATVIEAGGAELSATVAAASAALAQAGVAMRDLVSACSVSRVTEGGAEGNDEGLSTLLLDPTAAEEEAADRDERPLRTCPLRGDDVQIVATAPRREVDARHEAMQLAASGCARVDQALREVLRQGAEEAATLAGV